MKSRVDLGLEKKFSIVAALFFGVSLASFVAIRGYVYADSTTSASASVVVPDVCSISSTTTGHNATVAVGTSRTDIGTTDISVICNDNDGFSVYATGYSNDTVGNTNLIGVVSGLTIPTGTSSDASASNWSMKISPVTGNYTPTVLSDANGSYASYHIVPSTTTKVVTRTSAINVSSASEFRTTYAVAVAPAQTADTYVGKVKYTVVHPNYSNADGSLGSYPVNLSFGANTSSIVIDGVTYTSSSAAPELEYGTHTISATFPSGYELDSWSTTGNVSIASSTSNPTTMTVAGPGTLTLSAKSKSYLQNFTASTCSGLTLNTNYTFYDSRDENDYTVARLADGNCWMTQNLRLGKGNGEVIALNSTNSDLPAGRTFNLKASGMGSNQPDASGDCNVGDWYPDATAEYYDVSHLCINTNNMETYGVYYNWYTATAGTGTYDVGVNGDEDAVGSICPKGWRLPPFAGNKSYDNLLVGALHLTNSTAYATMQNFPYNFPLSGATYGEGIYGVGDGGYFWSSTASNEEYAYSLDFVSSHLYPQNYGDKGVGIPVRCVLETRTLSDLTYMQDINTTEGTVATLTDRRDGTTYHVGKLADGRVWMLDNLALDLTTVSLSNLQGNTNASDTALNYLKNGGGTTTDQYPTAGVGTFTSSNEYSVPRISLADKDVVPQGSDPLASEALANNWKVGGYYNYCAASAGTYCWGNGTSSAGSQTTDPNPGTLLDVQEDICPLGWRMPTSDSGGEYQTLDSAYSSNYTDFRRALSTPLSGNYASGSARDQGTNGYFWSSTWYSTYDMRYLRMDTSGVWPSYGIRSAGFSVRCIAK